MRGTKPSRVKILPQMTLLLSLLTLHALPGIRVSEAVPPPPPPPAPHTQPRPQTDTDATEWINTDEVTITHLSVPLYVKKGDDAELECQWSPRKTIYSLKWYYNDGEFFSYKPEADPQVVTLPAEGFQVNVNSTGEKITLLGVDKAATGSYKCEVTMEGPGFVTADKSGEMTVVDVPQEKPRITGAQHLYRIGDLVDLTCSSAPSLPAADLTWYINDRQAPARYITPIMTTTHTDGLKETHKRLRFKVSRQHFRGGEMTLRCEAKIRTLYTKTQQHSVDGMLTYEIPVLSSREKSAVTGRAGGGGGGQLVEMMVVVVGALVVVEVVKAVVLSPSTTTTTITTINTTRR